MKRVTTIIRQIDNLETEMRKNYTDKEILKGIEKTGHAKGNYLVSTIYSDVSESVENDEDDGEEEG